MSAAKLSATKRPRGGEVVYHEKLSGRHQAGVRCVRCGRVINVEWTADDLADVECRGHGLRLGRCATCYIEAGDTVAGDNIMAGDTMAGDTMAGDTVAGGTVTGNTVPGDPTGPAEGYIYVTLEPGGRLAAGPSSYDRCEDLEVLLTGVASCGCCQVTVVHCGWCAAPVATRHPALEEIDERVDCGYCNHCDRIITVVPSPMHVRRTHRFIDRVASPDEIADERWAIWREQTLDEVDDVATWLSLLDEITTSDLELLEIAPDQIEYPHRQDRLTMEGWLATFGGRGGVAHDGSRDVSE
ncbi:MAG: hypothetical protein ABI780_07335 [Ardenticatenales bacterium]